MSNTVILCTTYKKSLALDNLLESLVKNDYGRYDLVVADDYSNKVDSHGSSAGDVCKRYKGKFKSLTFCYNEKTSQVGISKNKNRCLREFFKGNYDSFLSIDDDIEFHKPGLIEHLEEMVKVTGLEHCSGYWTDNDTFNSSKLIGLSNRQWAVDFPVKMEDEYVTYHDGSQGVMTFSTKNLAERAGYLRTDWKFFYGAEHSEYSSRLNRLSGWVPTLFPVFKYSGQYFHGQNIPNDYEISHPKIEDNMVQYREALKRTEAGYDLKWESHGLPKKEKVIIV